MVIRIKPTDIKLLKARRDVIFALLHFGYNETQVATIMNVHKSIINRIVTRFGKEYSLDGEMIKMFKDLVY